MYVCVSCTYWLMHWSLSWLIPPENSWSPFMPRHWEGWISEQASQSPCLKSQYQKKRGVDFHETCTIRAAHVQQAFHTCAVNLGLHVLFLCESAMLKSFRPTRVRTEKSMTFKLLQRWKGDPALVIKSFFNFASFFFKIVISNLYLNLKWFRRVEGLVNNNNKKSITKTLTYYRMLEDYQRSEVQT